MFVGIEARSADIDYLLIRPCSNVESAVIAKLKGKPPQKPLNTIPEIIKGLKLSNRILKLLKGTFKSVEIK